MICLPPRYWLSFVGIFPVCRSLCFFLLVLERAFLVRFPKQVFCFCSSKEQQLPPSVISTHPHSALSFNSAAHPFPTVEGRRALCAGFFQSRVRTTPPIAGVLTGFLHANVSAFFFNVLFFFTFRSRGSFYRSALSLSVVIPFPFISVLLYFPFIFHPQISIARTPHGLTRSPQKTPLSQLLHPSP